MRKWFASINFRQLIESITPHLKRFHQIFKKEHITFYGSQKVEKDGKENMALLEIKVSVLKFQEKDSLIIVITDITQRDMVSRLEGVNEYKINLLASFSHELRTPLNGNLKFLETAIER